MTNRLPLNTAREKGMCHDETAFRYPEIALTGYVWRAPSGTRKNPVRSRQLANKKRQSVRQLFSDWGMGTRSWGHSA
jgi:hypothetical protein